MKKNLLKIVHVIILSLSFALPVLIPQNAFGTTLDDWCYSHYNGAHAESTSGGTRCVKYSNSTSTNGHTTTGCPDVDGWTAESVGNGRYKCTGPIITSSGNGDDSNSNNNDNDNSNSNSNDSNNSNNSDHSSGSNTSGSSNANITPTASTPDDMNKVCPDGQVYTTILGGGGCQDAGTSGEGIFSILGLILNILTYGVGIAGVLGIVISGIQYLTARDNEQQVAKAKSRIINIIIGLAIYAVMWGFLQWIIPGGILNGK